MGRQGRSLVLRVVCSECSKDLELFPAGSFVITAVNFKSGIKPCGCGRGVRWTPEQYLIRASKVGEGKFNVLGLSEEFHGKDTKLDLYCTVDGYKWSATIHNIINGKTGCPKCKGTECALRIKLTEEEAFRRCKFVCDEEGYTPNGFPGGYILSTESRFEYTCPKHGVQNVNYNAFVNTGSRCSGCAKDKHKERLRASGNASNGYYPERKDEIDFLYILDFDKRFIKVGRSFDINQRIRRLKLTSKVAINRILKLRIFTATHQEIYDFEQSLLHELRRRNFQHNVGWSTECFGTDCLDILNNLLDNCKFTELTTLGGNFEK